MAATVLVVEDDLEINELLGEYLSLEKINYLKATSGKDGLDLAQTAHPDAIVLDLMLPDLHGFEVARSLANHRATYDIPVIILSCMCQACDKEKAFVSGAMTFMNKPFLPDDLIAAVKSALAWKAELPKRPATQTVRLGAPTAAAPATAPTNGPAQDTLACTKAINQMIADLFTQTDLPDPAITGIRDAMELLQSWAVKWDTEHQQAPSTTVEYKIKSRGGDTRVAGIPIVEWTIREDVPGMLAEAFFKPASSGTTHGITSLIGWGGSSAQAKPLTMPPAKWLQLLSKTGALTFEKDAATQSVRFTRATSTAASTPSHMQLNATR